MTREAPLPPRPPGVEQREELERRGQLKLPETEQPKPEPEEAEEEE